MPVLSCCAVLHCVVLCCDVPQVALVEQLLDEVWAGPAAVVLNPEWGGQGVTVPEQYRPLVDSVEVAYCFLPVAISVGAGIMACWEYGVPGAVSQWGPFVVER